MLSSYDLKLPRNLEYNKLDRAFIGSKVNCVRWKPEPGDSFPNYLVTGNYDEPGNHQIELYHYPDTDNEADLQVLVESYPKKICKFEVDEYVSQLKFMTEDELVYCCGDGRVGVIKIEGNCKLERSCTWKDLGSGLGPATCLDVYGNDVLVGGESGQALVLSPGNEEPVGEIPSTGSCLSTALFLRQCEIVTTNLRGQISLWDTRSNSNPSQVFPFNKHKSVGVRSSTVIPSQKHVLLAGGEDGDISVWDMRFLPLPVVVFNSHQHPVTNIQFHSTVCSNMFTSSTNGEVWHWSNMIDYIRSSTRNIQGSKVIDGLQDPQRYQLEKRSAVPGMSFMNSGATPQSKMIVKDTQSTEPPPDVTILMDRKDYSTNSIDICREQLICATDNECLVIIKPLLIK